MRVSPSWIIEQSIVYGGTQEIIEVYIDAPAFTKYYCDSTPGTQLTDALWRVKRLVYNNATFDEVLSVRVADSGRYSNPATDLATVQGLSYS